MKHRFSAKLMMDNEQVIENSDDDLIVLTQWMTDQAGNTFSDVKGEIIDNRTHRIVRSIHFSPVD